jgi:hypothetical protein
MRIEGSNRRLSLHWTSLAEGNANFSIVIVFRYADDLMVGFEHREEAERLQGINGHASAPSGETSQRKTNLQLASGAFSCKVAGERTKKAPLRGGRTGSNGQQHPVVIDCEVLQKRRSRCTTPGELRATRRLLAHYATDMPIAYR